MLQKILTPRKREEKKAACGWTNLECMVSLIITVTDPAVDTTLLRVLHVPCPQCFRN